MAKIYNAPYSGDRLSRVAFPMGGFGAGMICLEGTGALSHVSLRHRPEVFNEPMIFGALQVKGAPAARVLEGPVPLWKAFGPAGAGNGASGKTYGLPRFAEAEFAARFPFGIVSLRDETMPVAVEIAGWSPFIPGDANNASLPVCALEYRFCNTSQTPVEAVFSFHAANFMAVGKDAGASVAPAENGFLLAQPPTKDKPWDEGAFAACLLGDTPAVDCAWFRGGWFDALTMLWKHIDAGDAISNPPHAEGGSGGGGSLYLPFTLEPGKVRTVRLLLTWYVPKSDLRVGADQETNTRGACCGEALPPAKEAYVPWYAARFASISEAAAYWRDHYAALRAATQTFTDCFYDTTLPPEVVEAVAANLPILKSSTCLRQADGRFWGWEGCCDGSGCCSGTCTHVWNYAQALPHLFPALERSLRETEFLVSQDASGHQTFRASLPIRPPAHDFHAAADGQLGGIVKVFREWRISGDTDWLRDLWPRVKDSLDYCIGAWDPDNTGTLREPHHNTYDIEFWGADGMCTSFYLSALRAAVHMGRACGDDVRRYEEVLARGKTAMETALWNGEYFIQRVQWKGLHAVDPTGNTRWNVGDYSPEARALLEQEGPKYQYGGGCLSDGVLGDWLARVCGLETVLDPGKVASHVISVFKYNFRASLADHANPQRPSYAFGQEGGLLLCSWPQGGELSLPFVYSNEVWTGIEYQAAAHLILLGKVEEGLRIVRAVRDRYDGRWRNPFNEYECGHWYARAMSSYSLLQALTGARYDALEKILYLDSRLPGDFRAFLATATGYATVGLRDGKPFVEVKSGTIEIEQIVFAGAGIEVM